MPSLEQKTLSGFKWNFIESFSRYFLVFFVSIILARLLSPEDYGLVGMTAIFVAISKVFIDGGFSDALIRTKEPSQEDYSTVFFFNLFFGFLFYSILFISAKIISDFFNEPQLIKIIRFVGLGLIIGSTSIIQTVILRRRLDFKLQTKVSVISNIVSGTVSISMAFTGYGVWSLVLGGIISSIVSSLSLWYFNKWRPKMTFRMGSIKKHFNFGSKIMVGSFINAIYKNIYYVLIGKLFPASELGYYTKADNFQKLPSENIDIIVRQVTYPLLSSIQDENLRLKKMYKILIRMTSFIVFILLFGMVSIAEPMILTLLGEKWLPTVPYMQLLCFVGIFYPLISINLNGFNVKGRSDLSLWITILNVVLTIPSLLLGYFYGIIPMILGMIAASIFTYLAIIFLASHTMQYAVKEQLVDIWSSLKIALLINFPVFILGVLLNIPPLLSMVLQCLLAVTLFFTFGSLLKNQEYQYILRLVKSKINVCRKYR